MVDSPATTATLLSLFADGQADFSITAADARRFIVTLDVRAPYSVAAFGAKGDGSTDDSLAFQNALDFAGTAGGGIVYVPPTGIYYLLGRGVNVPAGVVLKGAGTRNNTRPLAYTPSLISGAGSWILSTDAVNPAVTLAGGGSKIEGMNFTYNQPADAPGWTATQYPYAIHSTHQYNQIINCWIINGSHGIHVDGSNIPDLVGCSGLIVENCDISCFNVGMKIEDVSDCIAIRRIQFENILSVHQGQYMMDHLICLDAHRIDNPWISDINFFSANTGILLTNGATGSSIINCTLHNLQFNLCAQAIKVSSSSVVSVGVNISSSMFQNTPISFLGLTPPLNPWLINFQSDNIEWNFSACQFVAANLVIELGNGGAGTHNAMGFPNCTFAACKFEWNLDLASNNCFNVNANAKVSESSCFFNSNGSGAKFGGAGQALEAVTVNL